MAVPLRIGGGSRLKILEALACGLPVVSTRVGAEGLRLEDGRDLTVVERLEDMAAALVRCIRAPEQARRMAEQGRGVVREQLRLGRAGGSAGSGVGKSGQWSVVSGRPEGDRPRPLIAGVIGSVSPDHWPTASGASHARRSPDGVAVPRGAGAAGARPRAEPVGRLADRVSLLRGARPGRPFLDAAAADGFRAVCLKENAPHFLRAAGEVADWLRRLGADVLCCSGYKPDLIGWLAARRAGVPVVAIAHGWTAATWKVRCYEALDRWVMRRMDAVVCVSEGQAVKVRRAGVPPERAPVIRNAIRAEAFGPPDPAVARNRCMGLFAQRPGADRRRRRPAQPGKGVRSADRGGGAARAATRPDVGFVVFGDGPLRDDLTKRIAERGLQGRFVLAGFRPDLERVLPACDLAVSSSHTEGLPVVVLEEMAAGLPVVATAVGGTPEVVEDGVTGSAGPAGRRRRAGPRRGRAARVAGTDAGDGPGGAAARRDALHLRRPGGTVRAAVPPADRARHGERPA